MPEFPVLTQGGNGSGTSTTVVGDKTGHKVFERASTQVSEAWRWSSNRLQERHRQYTRRYAQYRGNMALFGRDPIQGQLRSQLWIAKSGSLVETVLPRTIGDRPNIEVSGESPDFDVAGKQMDVLLGHYLRLMNFFEAIYYWWKDACIFGLGVTKAVWSYREAMRRTALGANPFAAMPISQDQSYQAPGEVTSRAVVEDMPRVLNVDLLDFYYDYTASRIPRMDFVIEGYELPVDLVQSRIVRGYYTNLSPSDVLNYAVTETGGQEETYHKEERDRAVGTTGPGGAYTEGDAPSPRTRIDQLKKVRLWDYWGRFDLDGDGKDEECLLTCIGDRGGSKAIRALPNPYADGEKPYCSASFIPLANDFQGIGILEWVEQLQREMNTRYNMSIDNANYILNAMLKVKRSANIPDAQLKSRPSGRIDCDDPTTDVVPLDVPVIIDKVMAMQQMNDQLWQDITGVSSEVAGVRQAVGTAFHRTAGGIYALQQAADNRLRLSRLLWEATGIEPLGQKLISRVKQYMTEPVSVPRPSAEGVQYITVSPHQVNGANYHLRIAIAPAEQIGKMAEREKWTIVLNVLRTADPKMSLFDWNNIYTDWLEAIGIANPQKYLGQFANKLSMMHQMSILDQMIAPTGESPLEVGQTGPGGKLGPSIQQGAKQMGGAMEAVGASRGRAAQGV